MKKDVREFVQAHGLTFNNLEILKTAFVHSSYVNEATEPGITDNERLEFLGDSVLGIVASELLYRRFPAAHEGELTAMRASLVRRETLARFAKHLHLGDFLWLGNGEEESGGRKRLATLCATFEAVVGAIYLDQGFDVVRAFVEPLLVHDLDKTPHGAVRKDAKSRLQEWAQSNLGASPRYSVVAASGPDHNKHFTTVVTIGGERYGVGQGRSKQEASQAAAAMALARMGLDSPGYEPNAELEAMYGFDDAIA